MIEAIDSTSVVGHLVSNLDIRLAIESWKRPVQFGHLHGPSNSLWRLPSFNAHEEVYIVNHATVQKRKILYESGIRKP
jgi:hypothetical protein